MNNEMQYQTSETIANQKIALLKAQVASLEAYDYSVAHDLKDQVGSILSMTEFIIANPNDLSQNIDLIHLMAEACRQMNKVIDSFLLFATEREINFEEIDMGNVVDRALNRLGYLISKKQAKVVIDDNIVWPISIGYAPWVEEIWFNYISNALKHGGKPSYIRIGGEIDSQHNGMGRYWVRDYGKGIAQNIAGGLFKKTNMLDEEGVCCHGIGLTIVQRIISRLDGTATARNMVEGGCTFSFTLPLSLC